MTKPTPARPVIVWFRDDLRISDHPALTSAAATGAPLICLYVFDEVSAALRPPVARPLGGASRWWLAQSLRALAASLSSHNVALVLRRGGAATTIADVARTTNAAAVYWNDVAIAPDLEIAHQTEAALTALGVEAQVCRGDLLADPRAIRGKEGRGLRVFTPFWKRLVSLGGPPAPLPAPPRMTAAPPVSGDALEDWALEPRHPDWAEGLRETWTPGEASAQAMLQGFLDGAIRGYRSDRDRPDRPSTSRLSPHLRFGEISPRQLWHTARFVADRNTALAADAEKFQSELTWREFCRHLLFDHSDLAESGLQKSFDTFPWRSDPAGLAAWQRGQTGYPIVDAGMRELWHTGVMHNRVRMVVASFLVKHLLIDWREGERWFWDTLVDADPGSNPANWQWVAGCGADAAPYFRIFNPVLQGEKFDPDGLYVRRWVPELAGLPNRLIHKPWTATPFERAAIISEGGATYPEPIVDHRAARDRALAAYASLRNS